MLLAAILYQMGFSNKNPNIASKDIKQWNLVIPDINDDSIEEDTLSNVAKIFGNIGWEKRLCDLQKKVLGMVAFFKK